MLLFRMLTTLLAALLMHYILVTDYENSYSLVLGFLTVDSHTILQQTFTFCSFGDHLVAGGYLIYCKQKCKKYKVSCTALVVSYCNCKILVRLSLVFDSCVLMA